ncbi:MAG: TetR/AcrR family transcriptional regulator [Phycisphaerales bacterium]|nr:TetR/AcrR family transcriptional regulator [Phycisphaerales bacterium]MCB9855969.1 TetR/AcrR family transcriptional regulator [Phycisphaerales bacterium]
MATATTNSTRDQLFHTASQMFCEKGFHATSIRDIAERVGIQGGSIYSHFESKDDLLWSIVQHAADRFFSAIRPVAGADMGITQKLRKAVITHAEVITSDLDAAAVYTVEWRHLSPERRAEVTKLRDEYESIWRTMVDQGIREGYLAASDAAGASRFILSSLNYLFTWFRPDGPLTAEEVGTLIADYTFDGLRRRTV